VNACDIVEVMASECMCYSLVCLEMCVLGDSVFLNMKFCCYNTSNNLHACLIYYIYPCYFDMNMYNSL